MSCASIDLCILHGARPNGQLNECHSSLLTVTAFQWFTVGSCPMVILH